MTKLEALKALLEKVRAGQDNSELWRPAFSDHGSEAMLAFHGSLDAALALYQAVLPGWSTEITCRPFGTKPHQWHILLSTDHTGWGNGKHCAASADNPARAWLMAILQALIAQERDNA